MGRRGSLHCCICPMPWMGFLPPRSLLQPLLAGLRVALGRERSCVKVSGLRHTETQQRGVAPPTQQPPFCFRSRICAKDGPTTSSQALPVSVAYVLSLVSRALQEQNPEYAHPFPAHKGPILILSLRPPHSCSSHFHTHTHTHTCKISQEAQSCWGGEQTFTQYLSSCGKKVVSLGRGLQTLKKVGVVRNSWKAGMDTGEGPCYNYKSLLPTMELEEKLGPSSQMILRKQLPTESPAHTYISFLNTDQPSEFPKSSGGVLIYSTFLHIYILTQVDCETCRVAGGNQWGII